jgi:hypothetical protein
MKFCKGKIGSPAANSPFRKGEDLYRKKKKPRASSPGLILLPPLTVGGCAGMAKAELMALLPLPG